MGSTHRRGWGEPFTRRAAHCSSRAAVSNTERRSRSVYRTATRPAAPPPQRKEKERTLSVRRRLPQETTPNTENCDRRGERVPAERKGNEPRNAAGTHPFGGGTPDARPTRRGRQPRPQSARGAADSATPKGASAAAGRPSALALDGHPPRVRACSRPCHRRHHPPPPPPEPPTVHGPLFTAAAATRSTPPALHPPPHPPRSLLLLRLSLLDRRVEEEEEAWQAQRQDGRRQRRAVLGLALRAAGGGAASTKKGGGQCNRSGTRVLSRRTRQGQKKTTKKT